MGRASTCSIDRYGWTLLPGSRDDYVDLANIYLFVRAHVLKGHGGRLPAAAPVGSVNN